MTDANRGLPPATGYHRPPIRWLNRLLRYTGKLGLGYADLTEQGLIASARKETGLHFFGDESFREALRRLLHALEHEADLNPLGRYLARISLLRILKHRLLVTDLLDRHPEILDRKLPPPVVIVGLARSGTTRLHRLLASDERFLHIKAWESVNPVPWPGSYNSVRDPRLANVELALKIVLYLSPQIAAVHPLGTMEVEEEVGLIQHAFSSQLFEVMAKVPSFGEWLMQTDQTHAYEYMQTLMKIIGWYRGDDENKPWVMKTPQHMQDLDALMNVFPDARIVFSHRDPVKTLGSICSMTWNSIVRDTDHVDPHWVGREWLGKVQSMLHKTQHIRDEVIPSQNQIDIYYDNINRDWRAEVRRIYGWLGWELTPQALSAMQAWLEGNSQHRHGAHKYSLLDFGLDPARVDRELMFYRQRYDIPYEAKPNGGVAAKAGKEQAASCPV